MKKKIKIIQSIASPDFAYKPGDRIRCPIAQADSWIAAGIAAEDADDPADLKAQIADLQARLKATEKKPDPAPAK